MPGEASVHPKSRESIVHPVGRPGPHFFWDKTGDSPTVPKKRSESLNPGAKCFSVKSTSVWGDSDHPRSTQIGICTGKLSEVQNYRIIPNNRSAYRDSDKIHDDIMRCLKESGPRVFKPVKFSDRLKEIENSQHECQIGVSEEGLKRCDPQKPRCPMIPKTLTIWMEKGKSRLKMIEFFTFTN
eukprot:82304_1